MGTSTVAKQILSDMKTSLAAIVKGASNGKGYAYNYTPADVELVKQWGKAYFRDDKACDMNSPLYLIRSTGLEGPGDTPAFGELGRVLDVPVICAMRDRRGQRDPFRATTAETDVREDMIGDVIAKVMEDRKRGGVAFDTSIDRIDRERFLEGWIAAEVLFTVDYFHEDSKP